MNPFDAIREIKYKAFENLMMNDNESLVSLYEEIIVLCNKLLAGQPMEM